MVSQQFYELGNKPSRILARSLQQKRSTSFIAKIKFTSDNMLYKTNDIAREFRTFYQQVAKAIPDDTIRKTRIEEYLLKANLPKLSSTALEALEGDLTTAELKGALKSMANGKAPGPDGLTVAYYRTYADILLPHLTSYANSASAGGIPPRNSPCSHHNSTQAR